MSSVAADLPTFLSERQFAAACGVAPRTIRNWRRTVPGFPPLIRLSRGCSRYRLEDVRRFLETREASHA